MEAPVSSKPRMRLIASVQRMDAPTPSSGAGLMPASGRKLDSANSSTHSPPGIRRERLRRGGSTACVCGRRVSGLQSALGSTSWEGGQWQSSS